MGWREALSFGVFEERYMYVYFLLTVYIACMHGCGIHALNVCMSVFAYVCECICTVHVYARDNVLSAGLLKLNRMFFYILLSIRKHNQLRAGIYLLHTTQRCARNGCNG